MHSRSVYLVALMVIFTSPTFGQETTTKKFRLQLNMNGARKSCTTKYGLEGFCTHKSMCNSQHEIEVGGRISEAELREGGRCNLQAEEWCCASKKKTNTEAATVSPDTQSELTRGIPTPSQPVPSPEGPTELPADTSGRVRQCLASDEKDCPWLVNLYRAGEDYPYCLGAMIGSNTILTTATCELQARHRFLWAQIPSSENPESNYTIISKLPHPKYNSGTRLNDLALLSTLSDITWGSGGPKGACIDPELTMDGECVAANINDYVNLDMVKIYVTKGSCKRGGNVTDAMCAYGSNLDLLDGAPIMCQKNNFYVLSGITKTAYSNDNTKALLGNLDYAWITEYLKTRAGLNETDYLFKFNYN